MQQLFEFGQDGQDSAQSLIIAARFIQVEVPIRIARMAIELEHLAGGLSEMPSVVKTRLRYIESFFHVFEFVNTYVEPRNLYGIVIDLDPVRWRILRKGGAGHQQSSGEGNNLVHVKPP